jgi:hypothetical protein
MSYTLSAAAKPAPEVATVMAALGADVRCIELADLAPERWPEGTVHLHRVGRSTRGVELIFRDGRVSTRLVALANRDDWELAYRILETFAASASAEVSGEDGAVASLAEVRPRFHDVLLRETAAGLVAMRQALDRNPGEIIRFHGAVRDVFIGERSLRELPDDLALMERVRRLQYIETEGFEMRRPIPLLASGGVRLTVWTPDRAQAFEETDNVGLAAPSGSLTVPVSELPALAGERFHWLDERQFAIDAVPSADMPMLYAKAEAVAVKAKKWWQFWR